jgi:actin-related protein 6
VPVFHLVTLRYTFNFAALINWLPHCSSTGFSACYAVPFYDGQLLPGAVRRLNLGGKALTNLLKETVSYRSLNMADEGLLMERLKEQLCWVSRVSCVCVFIIGSHAAAACGLA